MTADQAVSLEQQLLVHRGYLMKFARLQLRNEAWAEDAVSETLLAALNKPQAFTNRSQLKTWLVGILKHKVIDVFRVNARTVSLDMRDDGPTADEGLDALVFHSSGHFAHPPSDWGNPEQDLQSHQFMLILEACTEKMPPAMGRVFLMREWLELSSDEICNELGLSSTNLYDSAPCPPAFARVSGIELVWRPPGFALMTFMPTCKEAAALLIANEDHLISLPDRVRVRLHVIACKTCPNFERQLLTMRNALQQWRNYTADETENQG